MRARSRRADGFISAFVSASGQHAAAIALRIAIAPSGWPPPRRQAPRLPARSPSPVLRALAQVSGESFARPSFAVAHGHFRFSPKAVVAYAFCRFTMSHSHPSASLVLLGAQNRSVSRLVFQNQKCSATSFSASFEPVFAQWIPAAHGKTLYGFDLLLQAPSWSSNMEHAYQRCFSEGAVAFGQPQSHQRHALGFLGGPRLRRPAGSAHTKPRYCLASLAHRLRVHLTWWQTAPT